MAHMRGPKIELVLTDHERKELQRYSRRSKSARAFALRAGVGLKCATGMENLEVAEELGVTNRVGAPRRNGDDEVERIIDLTLDGKPKNATHCSTRAMASKFGISARKIREIWRAFGFQPHRAQAFSLSKDPQFVEKVRDIIGLYMRSPRKVP